MNFPRAIGRLLATIGYNDKQEVFYIVDPRSGDVIVTRDASKAIAAKAELEAAASKGKIAEGGICMEAILRATPQRMMLLAMKRLKKDVESHSRTGTNIIYDYPHTKTHLIVQGGGVDEVGSVPFRVQTSG